MKRYKIINNVLGWVMFAVAAVVYCSTIEPTASFWDCPEFITTAYKLEIGHPPGAPFFMLFGNLFTQFVDDTTKVAMMVNTMSALLSATCILFLFWTITHLLRRLLCKKGEEISLSRVITIMGSGVVGALAYTFSDTFWFSAVEGEVYAFSSMFTALVFWLILKWEDNADKPQSDRWLILIAYLMGLSIGVHLLNLLCIPAIVLVYYYRRWKEPTAKGSLVALLISFVLVAVILYGVVPGIAKIGGWFELLFVNSLGMPFNTGLIIYIILVVAAVVWAIYESNKMRSRKLINISFMLSVAMLGIPFVDYGVKCILIGCVILVALWVVLFKVKKIAQNQVLPCILNTVLICFLMLMIGYSSYAVIVIRSTANPPMDQNSPEDIFTLGEYLGREQYGSTPLLYGQVYTSPVKTERSGDYLVPVRNEGAPMYQRTDKDGKDYYEHIGDKSEYVYAYNMLFPRIWSDRHAGYYESWLGGVDGRQEMYDRGDGNPIPVKVPTQLDNLRFFFSYQLNFMYWRYFMWNFAGRQNDIQSMGEAEHGNWITGIPFIDNARLGDQSQLPDELKENKGHNVFYCLPLILGLLGLFWQAYKGKKGVQQFWVVFFLFFMTGIAIVLYLNQTPCQPRERDYAYAGSFYAFAIWIGYGVAAIVDWLKKLKVKESISAPIISLICLLVPIQMASQTWDDHDRSGRYACRDFGQNYLYSMQETGNPIIYTNGDNDTFPLWYNQETEGVRTDARVCNLSYLQTDWYIDQMRRPAYNSPGIPITWEREEYESGVNEAVPIHPEFKERVLELYKQNPQAAREAFGENPFELKNILKYWVRSKDESTHFIPTDTIEMTIDKDAVRRSGMNIVDSIPDKIYISLAGNSSLYKPTLMMLEMIAQCNWVRPIYISVTVGPDNYLSLSDYFQQEGLAYRLTPFNVNKTGKMVDVEKQYDNMMHKFKFGNIADPKVYLDETILHMCLTHRRMFASLANALIQKGDKKRALEVLEYCDKVIPGNKVSYCETIRMGATPNLAESWISCGHPEKALQLARMNANGSLQYINWYVNYSKDDVKASAKEITSYLHNVIESAQIMSKTGAKEESEKLMDLAQRYYDIALSKGADIQL
ncbi:MAG: DUF2723 domain-containing protein [Prevotellaceae bacterium]|nr:DUF2723 domain-containing protein [Candidatus Faecinaster equi]